MPPPHRTSTAPWSPPSSRYCALCQPKLALLQILKTLTLPAPPSPPRSTGYAPRWRAVIDRPDVNEYLEGLAELRAHLRAMFAPEPDLAVWEWAEKI